MISKMIEIDIQYIAVKYLSVVWVQAQRPYDANWSKKIAEDFDPDKFDPLIVTKPNGQGIYHIIEGQHRRHALEMFDKVNGGNAQAPCRVVADADPARAAEIWLGVNKGRKSVSAVHEFKVAVVAKREPETAINKIVRQVGYRISSTKAENGISAVTALKIVYNRHDAVTLKCVLEALRFIWGSDPKAVSGSMIKGFGIFLHEFHPYVEAARLKRQMNKFSPFEFIVMAKTRSESALETVDESIAENLRREYNKGVKDPSRKLHHKDR
jgi:hypothetical protein